MTVSAEYLGKLKSHGEVVSWVNFLEKVGVKKGIVVERVNELIPKVSGLSTDLYGRLCVTSTIFSTILSNK